MTDGTEEEAEATRGTEAAVESEDTAITTGVIETDVEGVGVAIEVTAGTKGAEDHLLQDQDPSIARTTDAMLEEEMTVDGIKIAEGTTEAGIETATTTEAMIVKTAEVEGETGGEILGANGTTQEEVRTKGLQKT
jgi:hypothetical protein